MLHLKQFNTPYPNPYNFGSWGSACAGVPPAEERSTVPRDIDDDIKRYSDRFSYCTRTDKAWTVCLHNADVIDAQTAATLLNTLNDLEASGPEGKNGGGEPDVVPALGGNEDIGSLINLGRTMQEPMSRMQMRDQMLDFFGHLHDLIATVNDMAAENVDTVMPGHTHLSQANPITLALYLLSIEDSLFRGLTQAETAYGLVNMNSGGCGSTSGTTWPVDRWELTRLLGFDDLLEVTYDCESSQDHTLALLFALSNIAITLSKMSMDLQIWGLEEMDMIRMAPEWSGLSSMMPQKCHPGISEENRIWAADIIGETSAAMVTCAGQPHQDLVLMMNLPRRAVHAMARAKCSVRMSAHILRNVQVQKESMLEHVRQGYSCMTELAAHMVRELGFGGRRSHRICATLVRLARERGIPAPQLTGEMLDEAARAVEEQEPHIETEVMQRLLDPVHFVETHIQTGGPAPNEARRMIATRRDKLETARARQTERLGKIKKGQDLLANEVARILKAAETP